MNWFAPVDIYCERLDATFWSEPLNAISNLTFILAAGFGAAQAYKLGLRQPAVWLLIGLAFCIGIGLFLFHTLANTWSGFADTVPIWTFVAAYVLVSMSLIAGAPPRRIAVILVAVVAAGTILWLANDTPDVTVANPPTPSRFNGSEQYLPAVIAMLVFSVISFRRGHAIRHWFAAATGLFLVSLTLRTFDMALCDVWPYGNHVFWHLLNGAMIAMLLQAPIRNTQRTLSL